MNKFRITAFKGSCWSTPAFAWYDYSKMKNSYTSWDLVFSILCWEIAFGKIKHL